MGETNIHPANQPDEQATGHPANQSADHPRKKKRHVSTWVALASAATAIAAAVISGLQVNVAGQQNIVAEQDQLVSLTTLIGQQFTRQSTGNQVTGTGHKAEGTLTGPAGATTQANTLAGQVALLSVEGQAGAVLIRDLNGNGVAGIEYVEIGRALDYSGDTSDAITYYKDAVNAQPYDAATRGDALRFLAAVYYELGANVIAHHDMMRATKVFSLSAVDTRYFKAMTIAQAYLEDAYYEAYASGCGIAAVDMTAAQHIMGSFVENSINQAWQASGKKAYLLKCSSAG